MLRRHSLLWRLALLLMVTVVCTVTLSDWLNRTLSSRALLLSDEAKSVMRGYAADAEQAWRVNGAAGWSTGSLPCVIVNPVTSW